MRKVVQNGVDPTQLREARRQLQDLLGVDASHFGGHSIHRGNRAQGDRLSSAARKRQEDNGRLPDLAVQTFRPQEVGHDMIRRLQ